MAEPRGSDAELLTSEESERKKERKGKLLNNLITRQKIILTFSVPKDKVNNLATFMEISRREDPSFSVTVNKAIEEYSRHHAIPNPQARLDRMLELGLPHKPKWQCCVPDCRAKARHHLFLRNYEGKTEIFQVCGVHKTWRHNRFKFLIGVKSRDREED